MSSLRKIFRQLRTLLWTALTLLTILAAVVVGIGKLLMPYSANYQPELEAWLSKAFNQPVKVESFTGEWKAFGPRIRLMGVTLMPDGMNSEIAINRAALDIKPLNALIPGRPLYSFRIIGADLALERTSDGRYVLSGLGVSNSSPGSNRNPGLRDVALNGEVRLQDISLSFDDPERQIHLVLSNVNGRLKMDGNRMAAEIKARVIDRERQRVLGDLDAIVKVKLNKEQKLAEASWHVKTGELLLTELVRQLPHHPLIPVSGRMNAELWGDWKLGEPQHMQGVLDLRDAQLSSQMGPLLIDHLNSRFNFRFSHAKNWRMDLSDLTVEYAGTEWHNPRFSLARNLPENLGLWVSADYVELDYPLQLTQRIMATYNSVWPAALPLRAQGRVTDFDLVLGAKWQLLKVSGKLEDGRFWGWNQGPDIEGLNATVDLGDGVGNISFGGQSVKLDWLRVFRRPLLVAMNDCNLEVLWEQKTSWQFDLNYCRLENEDLSAVGRVRMASGEGKPEIDVNVAMERGDISRFGDYWPENVMSERTLQWLRRSLLSGQITDGRFSMVGDLDDFPFKNYRGRLQGIAPVDGLNLKYIDEWPQVRKGRAIAEFEGPGMYVEGQVGNIAGTSVDNVVVTIGDFKKPVLDIRYQTTTALPDLIDFIKRTPLLDGLALNPDQFVFAGQSDINGHIHARLGGSTEPLQVTGALQLKGNQFTDLTSGIVLDEITGTLNYDREGLNASGLSSIYRDYPVSLDITSDWDAEEVFRARLQGNLPVENVIPEDLLEREPLFSSASGSSQWDISLSVASVAGSEYKETWLEINSGLEGVAIDLPMPMQKPAWQNWPLLVRYPIRTDNRVLTADLKGRMQLKMELSGEDARPVRAAVQLGGSVEALPDQGLFVINGVCPIFDLDGWIDLTVDRFSQTGDAGELSLQTAAVDARQIMIFDRQFEDVGLKMEYQDGVITGHFDSADIDGVIRYYKNEQGAHSMSGEFDRLLLPDPVTEGMTMESEPSELPEMHFYAKEFRYLGVDLGETRIEGYPIKNGFHLESIEAKSPSLTFSARGDWIRDEEGERSDFNIHITSESLGSVLEVMDISSAMQGGQTVVHFDAWWQGPPAAFALQRLNGEMDLSIVQGNILTAEPGAGRMLGLLSLTELPRRLALDFRDVFDEGFHFDEAKGTMSLENGTSYTDDLLLKSTAAEISIVGKTDLVAQTFDYEFAVRPGVSKTLPVIGAIAGGPVGAAAGLALQALLRDALGDAAEARYTIRGPWTDPLVEPVEKSPKAAADSELLDDSKTGTTETEADEQTDTGTSDQQSTDDNNHD
jgi:uncharacterized protein (TIGR02099 family)